MNKSIFYRKPSSSSIFDPDIQDCEITPPNSPSSLIYFILSSINSD